MIWGPFVLLVGLLIADVPVGVALGLSGFVGIWGSAGLGAAYGFMESTPYRATAVYALSVIPLFILMGELAAQSGITKSIYQAINKWVGHLPGGLAVSTILASAGLGAVCGSSTAAAAMLSSFAVDEMGRYKYSRKLALGVVSVAGTLAILIPPSNGLILYAIFADQSVAALLMAGVIPGVLTAIVFSIAIIVWARSRPDDAPAADKVSWKERRKSVRDFWPLVVLAILVLGSIYSGAATATEAAAVGAVGTYGILALYARRLNNWSLVWSALRRSAHLTSMIFIIIVGATIFGYFMSITQTSQHLVAWIGALPLPHWAILGFIVLLYIILGFFMDQIAILTLTVPIVVPIVIGLGFNPVWFGVIVTKAAEIGLVTPPLGLNVYVVASVTGAPVEEVFSGIWRFVAVDSLNLLILVLVPEFALWLPDHMLHFVH